MSGRRAVGVLGGTFDPVHLGHLVVAGDVHHALGLDEVLLVPAGRPWQKSDRQLTPAHTRVRMTELATREDPRLRVSRVDVDRPGPTYTLDTVRDLRAQLGEGVDLLLVVGADAAARMDQWHEVGALLSEVRVVVVGRPGHALATPPELPADRFLTVPTTRIGISSSDVRDRVRRGAPVRYLVPDAVAELIRDEGLYREAA